MAWSWRHFLDTQDLPYVSRRNDSGTFYRPYASQINCTGRSSIPIHILNAVDAKFPTQLTQETGSTMYYRQILSHSSQIYWLGQCLMQNSPNTHHRLTVEANLWTLSTQSIGKLSRTPTTFDRRTQLCIDHIHLCYIIILFIYLFIRWRPRKNKGRLTYLLDKLRWPVRTAHTSFDFVCPRNCDDSQDVKQLFSIFLVIAWCFNQQSRIHGRSEAGRNR